MLLICWFCVLGYPYIKCTDASLMHLGVICNGNWTEWSAIWSKITRVISNLNESAARVQFEITSMISDQNCTTRSLIAGFVSEVRIWSNRPRSIYQYSSMTPRLFKFLLSLNSQKRLRYIENNTKYRSFVKASEPCWNIDVSNVAYWDIILGAYLSGVFNGYSFLVVFLPNVTLL